MPSKMVRAAIFFSLSSLLAISCAKDPDYGHVTGTGGGAGNGSTAGTGGTTPPPPVDSGLPKSFKWTSPGPLIAAKPDATHAIVSVKDPSVVFVDGRWHVFATTANTDGNWSIVYLTFTDWAQANAAPLVYLDNSPPGLRGYHAAPQVFYFAPQAKWYLVFQSGQPQYSTNDDIAKPEAWTAPVNFFPGGQPPGVVANKGAGDWLDFFVICDDANCHLFFTDDDGEMFRSQAKLSDFPAGFGDAVVAIQGEKASVFEGGMTYHIKDKAAYLTLVEAFGPTGNRFYRSFVSSSLDGVWTPLADSWANPFAGMKNVTFTDGT
ncbi:MAG TPA: non-reducing end alpha-L-arabinofuranosidase family hydrolase, partial [Polyangia bacterium]|nr:non-reducing end alpha-L-arabinofuranosidase family hydrolase [Polyangia bacterium]